MAISRCSLLLVAVLQGPPPGDSLDASGWLNVARGHLGRAVADTAAARAALDTADQALARALGLASGPVADSVRTFRLFAWGERALLAWRRGGPETAADVWTQLPADARLPPDLEEMGENLLRACPERGLLLTGGDADTYAASYLRYARRLRPDVTVMPVDFWSREEFEARLRAAAERRPVCASMSLERPPSRRLKWQPRPLVWVTGKTKGDRVPPEDFAFAALRIAIEESSSWAQHALAVYRRAVKNTPALCRALKTFDIVREAGCK